jgi:nucleoside-diphosphate-sugar epimerase
MQTILGSGGVIGVELARALPGYTDKIRLVSRNPEKVNKNDEPFQADLLIPEQVMKAVEGSSIVYLTVGFPYKTRIWQERWPMVMRNVIDACLKHNAKLVFFDNIYMYAPDNLDPITEDLPIRPASKKGKVRAEVVNMIWTAVKEDGLTALIARAADFYGPGIKDVSILNEIVINPLSKGKKANLLGSAKCKHSFTYTPDAAKATALLGNSPEAFGEAWHLPTAKNPFTGREWVEHIAMEFGVKPRYQVASKGIVKVMGISNPVMKSLVEMMYQYDRDYVFSSDKFEKKFGMKPTPYIDGIREVIASDYQARNSKS